MPRPRPRWPRALLALFPLLAVAALPAPVARAATLTVTKSADTNDGVCNADCSLREAIAVASPGDTIILVPGITTANVSTAQLTIAKNPTIEGDNPNNGVPEAVTVRRNVGTAFRICHITGGSATLNRLIIADGTSATTGGGVNVGVGATATLHSVTVRNNSAATGGGVFVSGGSATVDTTTIGGNTTTNGGGPFAYPLGTVVTLTPQPGVGQTFVGWTVDGAPQGWPTPLTITMNAAHTVVATFKPTLAFPDVGSGRADFAAIIALASRGTIKGYQDGRYGPDDRVRRDQMAALIARAMPAGPDTPPTTLVPPACLVAGSWDCENWGNTFSDRGGVDANLWRNAGTMQHYGVSIGYAGATCAAKRVPSPCYGPGDDVTYAQTISFITRAMKAKGYWVDQPAAPLPYSNVPPAHQLDVRTFHFYTSTLGGVPSAPTTTAGWEAGATRGWFARALWHALDSHWFVDRVP